MPGSFPCLGTALAVLQGYSVLRFAQRVPGDTKASESNLKTAKLTFPPVLVSDLFSVTFGSNIPKSTYFSIRSQNKSAQKRKILPHSC